MADQWYCKIAGQEIGPLSAAQLKAMAISRRLVPEDPVRLGTSGAWVPAQRVKGLFADRQATTAPSGSPPPMPVTERAQPSEPDMQAVVGEDEPFPGAGELFGAPTPPAPPRPAPPRPAPTPPKVTPTPPGKKQSPAGQEPFAFLEEVYAAPPKSAVANLKPVDSPKARSQQKLFLIILLSLLGVLTVLMVVLVIVMALNNGDRTASLEEAARDNAKAAQEKREQSGKELRNSTADNVKWLDATKEEWTVGDVSVKILGGEITQPRLIRQGKPVGRHNEDLLVLKLGLTNKSIARKLDYNTWDKQGTRPKLTDDLGNDYPMQPFSSGYFVEGQAQTRSIYPEKTLEDVLVFRPPVERAKWFRLEIPGSTLKGEGTGRFEIARSMLTTPPRPKEATPAEKAPAASAATEKKPSAPSGATPAAGGSKDASAGVPDIDLQRQEDGMPKPPKPDPGFAGLSRGESNASSSPAAPAKSNSATESKK